jgi:AraC family transcriptional regulator
MSTVAVESVLRVAVMSRARFGSEWLALETVHARTQAHVRLASRENTWTGIAASRFCAGVHDVQLPPLAVPAFGVSYGDPFRLERVLNGRRTSGSVTPGQLSILPPDAETRWIFDRTGDVALVFLSRSILDQAVEEVIDRDPRSVEIVPRFLIRDLVLERIAHGLLKAIREPHPECSLVEETLAQELVGHLLLAHSSSRAALATRDYGVTPSRLRRVQEFMRANLARPLSLQEMAAVAGMSLYHFARGFREATGRPPHRYLMELRLCEARTLLHDPRLPIGVIARTVGFTHSHFTAVFTRRMGMTPRVFRDVLER